MLLRRKQATGPSVIYRITSDDGSCLATFKQPTPQARLDIAAEVLGVGSILERYQYQLTSYKLGKIQEVPKLSVPRQTLQPLLDYIGQHLLEIQGLEDEDGNAITIDDLEANDLDNILLSSGIETIIEILSALNNQGGLPDQIKERFTAYVRGEEVEIPYTDIHFCVTQHNTLVGPDSPCPLHAPKWLRDIHEIILNERARKAEIARKQAEEKATFEKFFGAK